MAYTYSFYLQAALRGDEPKRIAKTQSRREIVAEAAAARAAAKDKKSKAAAGLGFTSKLAAGSSRQPFLFSALSY